MIQFWLSNSSRGVDHLKILQATIASQGTKSTWCIASGYLGDESLLADAAVSSWHFAIFWFVVNFEVLDHGILLQLCSFCLRSQNIQVDAAATNFSCCLSQVWLEYQEDFSFWGESWRMWGGEMRSPALGQHGRDSKLLAMCNDMSVSKLNQVGHSR